jgi:low affinity Fe/Cu permease
MAAFSGYSKFAKWVSQASGSGVAFCIAASLVLTWAVTGALFDYSDTWQLMMNTCSSIITLLMVFLIQNTLNRDSTALQIKLDELLRALEGAQNAMIGLEHLDDEQLARLARQYADIADRARRESDTRVRRAG